MKSNREKIIKSLTLLKIPKPKQLLFNSIMKKEIGI